MIPTELPLKIKITLACRKPKSDSEPFGLIATNVLSSLFQTLHPLHLSLIIPRTATPRMQPMQQPLPTRFYIVTPTFNSLRWLAGCITSVIAQAGQTIQVHHHVQDGGSTDGTREFLAEHLANSSKLKAKSYTFSYESVKDKGMYDAINQGWDRADATIDWLGHLNSDEQYQPDTLKHISEAGQIHPAWGAITGNCIWINEQGEYLCSRKPSIGWPWVARIWIPAFTCALFIRRKFYGPDQVRFDTSWKSFGDKMFCRDLINAGCKFGYLDQYMALFTHRGAENLGFQPVTEVERTRYWNESLTASQRRLAPASIFTAKVSRLIRNRLGQTCPNYVWIDPSGQSKKLDVNNHRWMI